VKNKRLSLFQRIKLRMKVKKPSKKFYSSPNLRENNKENQRYRTNSIKKSGNISKFAKVQMEWIVERTCRVLGSFL
jgi:hypothetical protein